MLQSERPVAGDEDEESRVVVAPTIPDRPALAANVELIGQMQGTGFKDSQWLVLRDGTFLQLSELLYRVAEQVNGERSLEEIAAGVTANTEWLISADQVQHIIASKLMPLRLVASSSDAGADTVGPNAQLVRSPLRLNLRAVLVGPRVIDPITRVLQILYWQPLLLLLLGLVAVAHWWVYARHGIVNAILVTIYTPGLLLAVLLILFAGSVFHEFGHASALRYGGGRARGIGAALYLIYPVLYTDATDSYRLGRGGRVRTDLGGFYFHLLFTLGIVGLYQLTHLEFLLIVVLLIDLDIVRQCIPFVRLDGYWVLSDLTGIPDLLSQIGPFVRGLVPGTVPGSNGMPPLKRWVAVVFMVYIIATVPVLALLTFFLLQGVPTIVVYTGNALLRQNGQFLNGQSTANISVMVLAIVQSIMLVVGLVGLAAMLVGMGRPAVNTLWRWSRPTPIRRLAGSFVAIGVVALLAYTWIPQIPVAAAPPAGVQSFQVASRRHVLAHVTYAQTPPVGGDHWSVWQNCGFYDIPIESEHAVHSLEHGAVWITYRPDLPQDEIDQLRLVAHQNDYVIVSPYPGLPAPVVASAWARQLRLDSASDPRLIQFIRAFRLGPQAPEPGGPCTGGVGAPK